MFRANGPGKFLAVLSSCGLLSIVLMFALFSPSRNTASADASTQEPPFTSLIEWILFTRRAEWDLISAVKTNGYLLAVFETSDGDIAFCDYHKPDPGVTRTGARLSVADQMGNDLQDFDAKKDVALWRRIESDQGPNRPKITANFPLGTLYPLRRDAPRRVNVRFSVLEDGTSETYIVLYDEILELSRNSKVGLAVPGDDSQSE